MRLLSIIRILNKHDFYAIVRMPQIFFFVNLEEDRILGLEVRFLLGGGHREVMVIFIALLVVAKIHF